MKKEKYYSVWYGGESLGRGLGRLSGSEIVVKATHANIAKAVSSKYITATGRLKAKVRVITEQEFLERAHVANDNENVRW